MEVLFYLNNEFTLCMQQCMYKGHYYIKKTIIAILLILYYTNDIYLYIHIDISFINIIF